METAERDNRGRAMIKAITMPLISRLVIKGQSVPSELVRSSWKTSLEEGVKETANGGILERDFAGTPLAIAEARYSPGLRGASDAGIGAKPRRGNGPLHEQVNEGGIRHFPRKRLARQLLNSLSGRLVTSPGSIHILGGSAAKEGRRDGCRNDRTPSEDTRPESSRGLPT